MVAVRFQAKTRQKLTVVVPIWQGRLQRILFDVALPKRQVAISYAIGKADPVALEIDTLGTGTVEESILCRAVLDVFNLRPAAIIEKLKLTDVIYADTATYGHFRYGLSSGNF